MAENNVISFRKAKIKQIDENNDELEIAKKFTRRNVNPKTLVGMLKKQLKARNISYRVSFPSCDLTGFDKKAVIIFPDVKLIFEFISKQTPCKQIEGWIVELYICSDKDQPIDCIDFIINKIEEIKQNA